MYEDAQFSCQSYDLLHAETLLTGERCAFSQPQMEKIVGLLKIWRSLVSLA